MWWIEMHPNMSRPKHVVIWDSEVKEITQAQP